MFARRAAAEVVAGDDDLGVAIRLLVQDEFGSFRAVVLVAHLVEQDLAETRPLDRAKMKLWYDLVRLDVDNVHRGGGARQCGDFLHDSCAPSLRSDEHKSELQSPMRIWY